MLRLLVLVLLLLNGAYFAWGQGWLLVYGWGPTPQREPQRLARQIHPEAITLLTAHEATKALQAEQAKAVPKKMLCLLSPVLTDTQVQAVRAVLQPPTWPAQSWMLEAASQTARWLVYMGKYTNPSDLDKKRTQLTDMKVAFESLTNTPLAPGLSLGVFDTETQANTALAALVQRGVRSARVLQQRPALQGLQLRLPAVDDALLVQLPAVRATWGGQALGACSAE